MSDTDLQLLARYRREHAEDAFAEIVRRHLGLVYSAARRQVRSPQLAEEVAQSAFTDLARNAHHLAPDTILTAWLYQVTRRTAIDVVRQESRRQLREQTATEMNAMNATADDWSHVEPLLDEAMQALDETDRAAVLLRYFESKSLREVGQALGTSDDTAQKRVSRAVERLREFFARRGVTVGASSLAVVISANAVHAAPVGLAVTISTAAALAGTTIAATATATAVKTIAMTTLQKTIIGATLAAAIGTGIYETRQAAKLREKNQALQQQQAPLAEQIQQLQQEGAAATNRLVSLADENARLKRSPDELLKLRGQVGVLRNQLQAATNAARRMPGARDAAKVPGEPLPDVDARIVQLSQNGTTVDDVIHVLGEPKKYLWGNQTFKKDELANTSQYILTYPEGVAVLVSDGLVRELRSEGQGRGFIWQGTLRLGSSLDDVLAALGTPTKTVVGQPLDFEDGVLYKNIEGRSGHCYYARADKNIRMFFSDNKVTALYIPLGKGND